MKNKLRKFMPALGYFGLAVLGFSVYAAYKMSKANGTSIIAELQNRLKSLFS